jgi:nitroimidazol reductase NimA-like FMN-containing flavoprotein (pyridoxamine 5'-phosphate oxidase superfamily)
MTSYHLRRSEKAIETDKEMVEVILGQKYMTLAMSKENQPYLVTVNYYFDKESNSVYFHCAKEGKKFDYLNSNPVVWGQVLEDNGYIQGKCDHAYRTVQFRGRAEFIEYIDEKIEILTKMMEQLEDEVTEDRKNNIKNKNIKDTGICKISIEGMSGKVNLK